MHVNFGPRGILQIDGARICFRNFEGRGDKYNREGDRNFAVVIDDEEIKDAMMEDVNEFGVGWNVKIKPPREEGDLPFMYMNVKVKFNQRGPEVYLISGNNKIQLDEENIHILDNMDIANVDMDIRPYDDTGNYGPFRAAYLQKMYVTQVVDRFADRYSMDEDKLPI